MTPKQRAARARLMDRAEKLLALATSNPNRNEAEAAAEKAFSIGFGSILGDIDPGAAVSIMERAMAATEAAALRELEWEAAVDQAGRDIRSRS